ncbi:hypothetical protein [Tsukamurella sp. 1534]|uniref:phage major capsid protein n=1 Tax=Tsukamurella sp. 1534 TaxID=1151061 RepID=UPI00030213C8|nr:hypothetical protein [Tsukamurella sp. 1534]
MAVQTITSVSDGGRLTVSDLVKNPLFIPTKLLEMIDGMFAAEKVFRNAGANPSGVVVYREGDPLFLEQDIQDVAEFGEIPVGNALLGTPRVAFAVKKALGVRVSKEMIDENNIDAVNRQMTALRNTMVRGNDRAFRALAQDPSIPSTAVAAAWDGTGKPRGDVMRAIEAIAAAEPDNLPDSQDDSSLGFEANTLVMHPSMFIALAENTNYVEVYNGNVAGENPMLTGALPANIFGLNVVTTRTWPLDRVLVCEQGTLGFYSDTRALQFTALYPEGGGPNGGPRETWRSDASQKRAMGIDQPKAGMWLTGLTS